MQPEASDETIVVKYHDKDPFWDKLLKGRNAHVISTCDAPAWWIWWQYRNSDFNTVKKATLQFCGITPVKLTRIGKMKYLNEKQKQQKLNKLLATIE